MTNKDVNWTGAIAGTKDVEDKKKKKVTKKTTSKSEDE